MDFSKQSSEKESFQNKPTNAKAGEPAIKNYFETKKGRMYFLFVFYILRMFTVAIWAVSSIPRGILNGIISGFQKSGFDGQAAKIKKSFDSAGIKEIFFDSIAEIFDQSDDEDELGPTGAPANRDQYNSR